VLDDREIDTCDACDSIIGSLSCESPEGAQWFLGSHLRLNAIVPLQLHRQTIDASMAAPLWADDVSSVNTHNYYQLLTYRKQGDISNNSLQYETAEALTLRSPYTLMNPAWLFEGTFEDWLSNTYPDLELSKKVKPVRTLCHTFPFETAS
jgi:hypothetical protein